MNKQNSRQIPPTPSLPPKKSSAQQQTTKPPVVSSTIDEKHREMLDQFNEIESKTIPELMEKRAQLKESMKKWKEDSQIEKYMDAKDEIQTISATIKRLKQERKRYLLNNSRYVFQYFEDMKNISSGATSNKNVNKLNFFFKIKDPSENEVPPQPAKEGYKSAYQNYWKNMRPDIANIQDYIVPSDLCDSCNVGEMIPQEDEGILICNNPQCGKFVSYIVETSKPTTKEPPVEVSYTAYIRLNHFKEILSQFQAKETTQIPPEVIEAIRNRIKKERITDMSQIDYDKMREILRKLGLNKYFEHIQYINSIFGIKPPIMSEELHETLCVLFIEIQKPWAIHCPPNRTNFFNYTYTLYQLCVLLGQTQYLPYIPLLKDRTKQLEQDMIWKKVCDHLGWMFIGTI